MEPPATRPHMPGYEIAPAVTDDDLLPWSWAVERLSSSHGYWLATIGPASRPHVMPVWGCWREEAVWFSTGLRSRKARNLATDPTCTVTTDDPRNPVVVEGDAERRTGGDDIARFAAAINAKYRTDIPVDFYDPERNGVFRLVPDAVFGLEEAHFATSPTRWDLRGDRRPPREP